MSNNKKLINKRESDFPMFKKAKGKKKLEFMSPEDRQKITKMFGTKHSHLMSTFLDQTARTDIYMERPMYQRLNTILALLDGIKPRDELESMLTVQMIGVHNLAMKCLMNANLPEQTFEGKVMNMNGATKLLRTFTAQIEALNRHRGKGQQKVTVEHVHVNEGGKAIVGTVSKGGGVDDKNRQ